MEHRERQTRLDFHPAIYREFKPLLLTMTHGKCAYCERRVDRIESDVDQFRPKSLYWWLAYDWSNLLIACRTCNVTKREHFPIVGDRVIGPDGDLLSERPVLLNPCEDDVGLYFRYIIDEASQGVVMEPLKIGSA